MGKIIYFLTLIIEIMPVKHTPTGEVHKGQKGGTTGCGFSTTDHPSHWTNTSESITCAKNGCKN